MQAFSVQTSTSMSRLADALAHTISSAPLPPLTRESVVVLSPGMGRWLSMELAQRLGICCGIDFRFPNDTLDACFRAAFPDLPAQSPFSLDTMTWRIAEILPDVTAQEEFAPLAQYLGQGEDRRLLQLSRTLADTFDQYTIYRPEMILDWDRGKGSDWQPKLWRRLCTGYDGLHRAALLRNFRKLVLSGTPISGLPDRISLFGISFLPPFHLEALSLVARVLPVTIYLFNPCGAYWGDLYSRRELAGLALRGEVPPEALEYYETGTPLLSSLGTQGQEFFNLLLEFDADCSSLDEQPLPTGPHLLGMIQHDIRTLNHRGTDSPRTAVSRDDRSLTIHSCHGPLREMEVLYDQILAMFDELPDLEPRSIVVMIPDLEGYAPYIRAVFGTSSGGRPQIPFTIADQSARSTNPLFETFMNIIGLPDSRFGINSLLEILESPQVMARFELTREEYSSLPELLAASGVRWGLDGEHRTDSGFPAYNDFSWRSGMDRLLLGYALEPDGDRIFKGMIPCTGFEGLQALLLGKLSTFVEACREIRRLLLTPRTLGEWSNVLALAAGLMTSPLDANDTGRSQLFSAFQQIRDIGVTSGFSRPIDRRALADLLRGILESNAMAGGFLNGRITFCAMLPMRSIPQRVICLAGMNDGVFPRNPRLPGFSLLNGSRRRGDRSVRDEDRYIFLETLMSATERIVISYIGQNDRDNTLIPPSVVVAELLDYVAEAFHHPDQPDSAPEIVTRHRLQGFSPTYFHSSSEQGLFTYAAATGSAVAERHRSGTQHRVFLSHPLPLETAASIEVSLEELKRFFSNPAGVFLSQRMKVTPHGPKGELDEREPFTIDSRTVYSLRHKLVQSTLDGADPEKLRSMARASGLLPPLAAGDSMFAELKRQTSRFASAVIQHQSTGRDPLPISFEAHGISLCGTLDGIVSYGLLRWRCAALRPVDRMTLWIEHLILNCCAPPGYPRESIMVCNDHTLFLSPVASADLHLADLLSLYRDGLTRPLHFFPQSSWQMVDKGIDAAEDRWLGNDYSPYPAESSLPANLLCHAGRQVLDKEFATLADQIYSPLRTCSREETTL